MYLKFGFSLLKRAALLFVKQTMLPVIKSIGSSQLLLVSEKVILTVRIGYIMTCQMHYSSEAEFEIERITRIIHNHPFPDHSLHPTLSQQITPAIISTSLVENVLGRLFAGHSNGLKAFEFFEFCLNHSQFCPSSDAFEKILHILTRMRYFDKAWELIEEIRRTHPSLLTLKSMSIVLSRIAKFQSYEETLEAFERLENVIFEGKKFGIDEFNVLLRAFCTQRQMKEARSIFNKLYSRFYPDTKTMNILLVGFKESGDGTAVELFYQEMVHRGFNPNSVTYNIRIDAYCKRGRFGEGLKLLEEMERVGCLPTVETLTTLIHGAGIARTVAKARQLFDEMPLRNLVPDTGAYNALMSTLIKSKDVNSAISLMNEMDERNIRHDNFTYHTMFLALMRLKGINVVVELYYKMIKRNFVPKTRTVVVLMKFLCENGKVDLGLDLWRYLMKKGYCPHSHGLDLLVTGLCLQGKVEEACDCATQTLERGRHLSKVTFRVLERQLLQTGDEDKLKKMDHLIKRLQTVLPPSRGHAIGISSLTSTV